MITLTVPPTPEAMGVLRATAGAIAARASLTIDQIDDVRMGVEEAGTLLLPGGEPITLTTDLAEVPFRLVVSVPIALESARAEEDSLAWMVLRGVTDSVELDVTGSRTSLSLEFSSEVAAGA